MMPHHLKQKADLINGYRTRWWSEDTIVGWVNTDRDILIFAGDRYILFPATEGTAPVEIAATSHTRAINLATAASRTT